MVVVYVNNHLFNNKMKINEKKKKKMFYEMKNAFAKYFYSDLFKRKKNFNFSIILVIYMLLFMKRPRR